MNQTINIPIQTKSGLRLSALNPKYLHTNSTSHTWPFSAIAELVDNAYDPDVKASQLHIDIKKYKVEQEFRLAMIFTDNGYGMTAEKLYKMLSFGFCEKVAVRNHMPVGHYGNGFKSGSMRLGKDALVFTKCTHTKSVGYLSQTYLSNISADTIIVPMVTWNLNTGRIVLENKNDSSLNEILSHSIMNTKKKIEEEFENIKTTGTRIIISNLRSSGQGQPEFDFSFLDDIRIPDDVVGSDERKYKREERQHHIPASDYSLRAYLSILYLKPKMQIFLRGSKVKTVVIAKSLSKTEVDVYKPVNKSQVKIVFGFSQNKDHYGIMMYHRNRLIKPYVRVGCQLKPNNMGVGVIGVIECDSLQPTHNKQDFDYSPLYRSTMTALGMKLNDYWNEKCGINAMENPQVDSNNKLPDQIWAQCDNTDCLKWRRLPDHVGPDDLPDKWYCYMHPLPEWRNCDIPEEEEEPIDNVKPYEKKLKKIEKELRHNKADKNIDINMERRRREKAEYEKQQNQLVIDRLQNQLQQFHRNSPQTKTFNNLFNAAIQSTPNTSHNQNYSTLNHAGSTPSTTVRNSLPPVLRHLSLSAVDQQNSASLVSQLQQQMSDPGPSIDDPDVPCIKAEETFESDTNNRLNTVVNDKTTNGLGSKKRPITLESSDEEGSNSELGHISKSVKTEKCNTPPLKSHSKSKTTKTKQTEQNVDYESLCKQIKDAIFQLDPDDLNDIDHDIIEDLTKQTVSSLGITLAKRSQALRNIRKKVVKLIQTIVSDTLQYPDVAKQSIDDEWVELLLDTIINIEEETNDEESNT